MFTDGYDLSSIGLVLPLVLASFGVSHITGLESRLLAVVSVVGAICTMIVIPETAGRSSEEINADAEADLAASGAD